MLIKPLTYLLGLAVFLLGCSEQHPQDAESADPIPATWHNATGVVSGDVPNGWNLIDSGTNGVILHHSKAPDHVLSIQRLTENIGDRPLRALEDAFGKHPYFSDFIYENRWAKAIGDAWVPAFHVSYLFLDSPALRHGHLLATPEGYYEIAYHAPLELHPEGLIGYERLTASIRIISHD